MKAIRSIVPAAGKGSRLQSISGDLPKAMFAVGKRPMLEYVLDNISFIDEKDIYIVVGYAKDKIIEHFGNRYHYVEQKEQLGTGHAVMECAEDFADFDGSVLITFGDMPLFRREEMEAMCRQHEENGADCTLMTAENASLKLWARVVRDENGRFSRIVEGKDCTPEEAQIKELFPVEMAGTSVAALNLFPFAGGAILITISGFLVSSKSLEEYSVLWIVVFLMMVVATALSFFTEDRNTVKDKE